MVDDGTWDNFESRDYRDTFTNERTYHREQNAAIQRRIEILEILREIEKEREDIKAEQRQRRRTKQRQTNYYRSSGYTSDNDSEYGSSDDNSDSESDIDSEYGSDAESICDNDHHLQEKMKVSIVSDPPDKKHSSSVPARRSEYGKIHTIKDLPKTDLVTELFGVDSSADEVHEQQPLFYGGRRLKDGAIIYAPTNAGLEWTFSFINDPNFINYILIFIILLFCCIFTWIMFRKRTPRKPQLKIRLPGSSTKIPIIMLTD